MIFVLFAGNGDVNPNSSHSLSTYSWVSSVSVCRNSDLAASGAGNGSVRLWALTSDKKDVRPLYDLPLVCKIYMLYYISRCLILSLLIQLTSMWLILYNCILYILLLEFVPSYVPKKSTWTPAEFDFLVI